MAQHAHQPATEAVERSKKRRRTSTPSQAVEIDASEQEIWPKRAASFDMSTVYQQASLFDAEPLSFPSFDWSSDDEDDDNDPPAPANTAPLSLGLVILGEEAKNTKISPFTVLEHRPQDLMITSLSNSAKKRKLTSSTSTANTPHMVRSIALSSHLSELASFLEGGSKRISEPTLC